MAGIPRTEHILALDNWPQSLGGVGWENGQSKVTSKSQYILIKLNVFIMKSISDI